MSTHTGREGVVECEFDDCDVTGKRWEFRNGRFCSTECELKHTGRKALSHLKFSHTRCFTCLTQLKEIEPPKPDEAFDEQGTGWAWDDDHDCWALERYNQDESRESAVGFQYRTPNADVGEKNLGDQVTTGTICRRCGNTDHTTHVPYLVKTHPTASKAISYLLEDDRDVDVERFHRVYADAGDLELAAGKALRR